VSQLKMIQDEISHRRRVASIWSCQRRALLLHDSPPRGSRRRVHRADRPHEVRRPAGMVRMDRRGQAGHQAAEHRLQPRIVNLGVTASRRKHAGRHRDTPRVHLLRQAGDVHRAPSECVRMLRARRHRRDLLEQKEEGQGTQAQAKVADR
jgi:hypothetical protein